MCEMDVIVRFWDEVERRVKVRYWDSSFFGHARADDLLKQFQCATKDIDPKKLYQISMDGPKVNFKFYKEIVKSREEGLFHKLLDIGSCNLHIIHGSFKTGLEKTWNLKQVLKAAFTILHDTPARREDYIAVTKTTTFPLNFCATRWVENKLVADRLLSIWANIHKIVKFWEKLPKSKRPSSKSYATVLSAVQDPLITAKLSFFSFLASLVEPYLKKYQSDQPLLPYMYKDLKSLVKSVLQIIVKPDELEKCKTGAQIKEINLDDKHILLSRKDMELGYGVKNALNQLVSKDLASTEQITAFKLEAQCVTKAIVNKLLEKTPLGSDVVRCACIFDPQLISSSPSSLLLKRMKSLLLHLMKSNILAPAECDKVTAEFRMFLEVDLKKYRQEFLKFDPSSNRLDDFFFHQISVNHYKSFAFVLQLVLTLSHGQASVERAFSVNNNILNTNMKPETMVARKIIKDHMLANNLEPNTIVINSELTKAAKGAALKWKLAKEDSRKEKEMDAKTAERDILTRDMEKMKARCKQMEKTINVLNIDFGECIELADKKGDLTYVSKGIGLKRKMEETKGQLSKLEAEYSALEEKKKKL